MFVLESSTVPLQPADMHSCWHARLSRISRTDTLRVVCSSVPLQPVSHARVGTLVSRTVTLLVVCSSVPLQPVHMLVLARSYVVLTLLC